MKIHFVTGKGGVGKSAVAAALAFRLSKEGERVLLAELGDESFYQEYFNLPLVDSVGRPSGLGFDVALWSGASCLREYALHLLKVESLYKLFFENPVSRTLIQVAPGLSELAITGKITSGPPRNVGPKMNYDVLVIDAFSTGHFLALLRAPVGMAQAIGKGPIADQSKAILEVLKDPKITSYHVVSLPEELPTQESLELDRSLFDLVRVRSKLWLNKVVEYPDDLNPEGPEYEREFMIRRDRQRAITEIVEKEFQGRWAPLPLLFETSETKIVEQLAARMTV